MSTLSFSISSRPESQIFMTRSNSAIVWSGSGRRILYAPGAEVHHVIHAEHGRTRDLGASIAKGEHLVFLNQDAVPCSDGWLVTFLEPLCMGDEFASVQGGIREFSDRPRFFWDSCGSRFYFTRESERWIPRYGGIGFSTVNAAIRRAAWEACPFGKP